MFKGEGMNKEKEVVAIVMGSESDWPTMKHAATILDDFGISYKAEVVSAHRTPDLMYSFANEAEANGFKVIIAGAGGAAHLPGMIASKTNLPVLGVPIKTTYLEGKDSTEESQANQTQLNNIFFPPMGPFGVLFLCLGIN